MPAEVDTAMREVGGGYDDGESSHKPAWGDRLENTKCFTGTVRTLGSGDSSLI